MKTAVIKATIELEIRDGEMHGGTRLQIVSHPALGSETGFNAHLAATKLLERNGIAVNQFAGVKNA